jgi:hypothetical protein
MATLQRQTPTLGVHRRPVDRHNSEYRLATGRCLVWSRLNIGMSHISVLSVDALGARSVVQ